VAATATTSTTAEEIGKPAALMKGEVGQAAVDRNPADGS
jgi:hypothetical protein